MSSAFSIHTEETITLESFSNVEPDVESHHSDGDVAVSTPQIFSATLSVSENRSLEESAADIRINEVSLAPVDKGFGAWSFLAAAFLLEIIIWGFPNSYGVFLTAYLNDPHFGSQHDAASLLPLVGTLSSGVIYCSGPIIYPLTSRYPRHRRTSMFLGMFVCFASLFGASYASEIWTLVLLQGAAYGIGGSLLYAPCISYMSEWFVERRGLANGVIFAGNAAGGLLLPIILPFLLRKHSSSITLRILSIALLILLLPVIPFVRGRLPDPRLHGPAARDTRRTWTKDRAFWFVMLTNTVQGFAYFVPIIWLPSFASSLHLSDTQASLVISLLNGFSVISRLSYGALSDHLSPWMLGMSSLLLTSLSTFVLWGVLSTSLWGILVYGIAYGTLAGGWSSLWTGFVRPIAKDDPTLSTTIFGILMLSRGLGSVLSTPISTSLFRPSIGIGAGGNKYGFEVDGGKFENMIFYVGSVFAGAGILAGVGWMVEKQRSPVQTRRD